jgi:hypothetical protein
MIKIAKDSLAVKARHGRFPLSATVAAGGSQP